MINGNDPAYPSFSARNPGISIRLDLIKAALTGLCANPEINSVWDEIGKLAVNFADQTIKALNDTEPE